MTYEGTIESAPQYNAARANRSDSREQDRLNYSHDAFSETALADLDSSEALYKDAARLLMAARINAGFDPLLSGNESVSTMRRTAGEQSALQVGPIDTNLANRRSDTTVATRDATNTPVQQRQGGAGDVAKNILGGTSDGLTVTRVATNLAIGAAVCVGSALLAPKIAIAAAIGATAYGAYSLVRAIPGWVRDAKVVANPDQHTEAQLRQAENGLRAIGAGTVDIAVGAIGAPIGAIAGKALRPAATSATATITEAFTSGRPGEIARSAFNTASTRAADLKSSVSTHLSDASTAVSRRATDLYNSHPSLHPSMEYMGGKIKTIGMPVINGVSGIPSNIGRIADGIKSIATPSEATRTSVLSFADRGMQKAERGLTNFNTSLENAGNAYISAAHFTGNRAMAVGNSAIAYAKPHVESALASAKPHVESAITTAKPYAVSALETTRNVGSRAMSGSRDAYDLTRAASTVAYDTLRNSAAVMGERIGVQRAILGERMAAEQFAIETQRVAQNYWRLPSVGKVYASNGDELGPIVRNANGNNFYIERLRGGNGVVHPLGVERFASGNARYTDVPNGLNATSPLEIVAGQIIPLNNVSISPVTRWMAAHNYRMRTQDLA